MERVRILTKRLYEKDRKGNVSTFNLPVLTIYISEKDLHKIKFSLQGYFDISIGSFDIRDYVSEMPGILFIDHDLVLAETESGWRLTPSIKRDTYIDRR